jgi:hypothetical protein
MNLHGKLLAADQTCATNQFFHPHCGISKGLKLQNTNITRI